MPVKKPIMMGNKVKDVTTGFAGHVTAISERPNAATMYGVQPPTKKGSTEYPKAVYIDGIALDVIDKGNAARLPEVDSRVRIGLGDQVEDTVSGLVGITTEKITFQNGCVHFVVMGRLLGDKKEPPSLFLQHDRLKLLMPASELYKAEHGEAPPKPEPLTMDTPQSRPGGPARDVIRP